LIYQLLLIMEEKQVDSSDEDEQAIEELRTKLHSKLQSVPLNSVRKTIKEVLSKLDVSSRVDNSNGEIVRFTNLLPERSSKSVITKKNVYMFPCI